MSILVMFSRLRRSIFKIVCRAFWLKIRWQWVSYWCSAWQHEITKGKSFFLRSFWDLVNRNVFFIVQSCGSDVLEQLWEDQSYKFHFSRGCIACDWRAGADPHPSSNLNQRLLRHMIFVLSRGSEADFVFFVVFTFSYFFGSNIFLLILFMIKYH